MSDSLPSLKRFAAATLLLLAGLFLTGGRADAGCGEPMLTLGQHADHAAPEDQTPDQAPAKRCTGPNCSAAPAPMPAPLSAPPKVGPTSEQWANHSTPIADLATDGRFQPVPSSSGRPVRRPTTPFHPPRSV